MTPTLLGGSAAILTAYIALLIRNDCGGHRCGPSPWDIIAQREQAETGYVITGRGPTHWERGSYTSRHTVEAIEATGEIPLVARPRWSPAATLFSHNPPLAITAG